MQKKLLRIQALQANSRLESLYMDMLIDGIKPLFHSAHLYSKDDIFHIIATYREDQRRKQKEEEDRLWVAYRRMFWLSAHIHIDDEKSVTQVYAADKHNLWAQVERVVKQTIRDNKRVKAISMSKYRGSLGEKRIMKDCTLQHIPQKRTWLREWAEKEYG